MLRALEDSSTVMRWMTFGGEATCRSYGLEDRQLFHNPLALQPMMQAALPETHRDHLNALPLYEQIGDYLFVHAGVRPDIALPDQDPHDLIWIREEFLQHEGPLPFHVVHGHTPARQPERRRFRTNVDTGAVYGGALTAAVLEGGEIAFLSVPTV